MGVRELCCKFRIEYDKKSTSVKKDGEEKARTDILLHNSFGAGFFIIGFLFILIGGIGLTSYYSYSAFTCFIFGIILIILGTKIAESAKPFKISLLKENLPECPFCHSIDSLTLKPLGEAEADYIICNSCEAKWHIYYDSMEIRWMKLISPNIEGEGSVFLNIPRELEFWKKLAEKKS